MQFRPSSSPPALAGSLCLWGSASHDYSPFGEAYTSTGTVGNPLRFAGRELDASAGLYYVRARWYDPYLGRFISEDPIGLAGGINNYAYALNDPVNLNDPTGLCYRHANGREIVVAIPGWEGGEAEWDCTPWHSSMLDQPFFLLQDRAANPSTCLSAGCKLRDPSGDERTFVDRALDSIRQDNEFCRSVQAAGRDAAARDLQIWDNEVRALGGTLYGNAPLDSRRGGVVMYLYSGALSVHLVVHESIHNVHNPASRWDWVKYGDHDVTPFGSIDQAATFCLR